MKNSLVLIVTGIIAWVPMIAGWVALIRGDLFEACVFFSFAFGFGCASLFFGNKNLD